jgi:hypothetical protein
MKTFDILLVKQMQAYLDSHSSIKGLVIKTDNSGIWIEDQMGKATVEPDCLAELSAANLYAQKQLGLSKKGNE